MQELQVQFSEVSQQVSRGFFDAVTIGRIIGYVLVVFFVFAIIYSIISLISLRDKKRRDFENHIITQAPRSRENPHMKRWEKVTEAISSPNEQLWRVAIIESDIMLEEVVTSLGYQGETFGEKLKQISPNQIPWIDGAWEVHRLRNILAHEGGRYQLNHREAYRAYKIYESILYTTGYLS